MRRRIAITMKKGLKTIALFVLVVLTLTAVLSACSDGKGDADNNASSASAPDSEASDGYATSGEPIEGGEITVGISQDLDSSLDPHEMVAAGTAGTREVLFNVFEGLLKPDSDGNLTPAVASGYTVDGTIYTFTLRDGVTFHNGQTVTAEDVVYSIERIADSSSETTYVSAFSVVTRVEAVDDSTVVIEIEEADPEFIASLTVAIIPMNYDGQGSAPIGTGPFKFLSYALQESLVVEKYEDYWGDKAFLDKVTFKIYSSIETMIMSLNSGAVDICAHLGTDEVAQLSTDSFDVLEGTMNLVQALYLNNAEKPFDDVRVRQALCHAVNVDEIMQVLSNGMGAKVGSSMIPAFTKYFNADLVGYYSYDPDKARKLLEQAGYFDGFSMTITVPSNYEPHVNTAEVIIQQLAAVGIKAVINSVEWTTWYEDTYVGRNYQSTVIGVDAPTPTAQAMLGRFVTNAPDNFINYSNESYDEIYESARLSANDAEQVEMYKELQEILAEDAANVYLQDLCDLVAVNRNLTGYEFYPMYVMDLSTVHYVE